MARPYEGTYAHWVEQHGVDLSIEELLQRAAKEKKDLTRKQMLQARYIARKRLGKVANRGSKGRGRKAKASKSNGRNAQVELLSDSEVRLQLAEDEGPPAKHTALRRLILDIGMEQAQKIFDEFRLISERMR